MWKHDPITFYLRKNYLVVTKNGRKVQLGGLEDDVHIRSISGKGLKNSLNKTTHGIMAQIFQMAATPPQEEVPRCIVALLDRLPDIFAEPQSLPTVRHIEHTIQLKEGSQPIQLRPYRYSHILKNEIEKLIPEMLKAGQINSSCSPFASPVLLVKKKDHT